MDCNRLVKRLPSMFCDWCQLKRKPMHEQAEAAKRRLSAVPEALHMKRSQKLVKDDTPPGAAFCAGCQTFCPDWYFGKGATQCRGCMSLKSHAAMVQKTYGIDSIEYERILRVQGGKCGICRQGFKTRRGAVDHSHKTDAVRGILCSKCNWEALGALHDEPQAAWNAYLYLIAPPAGLASETWEDFLQKHEMPELGQVKVRRSAATPAIVKPSADGAAPKRGKSKGGDPIVIDNRLVTKADHERLCYLCLLNGDDMCCPF